MPLVRSSGNIPADVEQESADVTLTLDDKAGGDAPNVGSIRRPRTRQQTRREATERDNGDEDRIRKIVNDSLRDFRNEISEMIASGFQGLAVSDRDMIGRNGRNDHTERTNADRVDQDNHSVTSFNVHNERTNRDSRNNVLNFDRNSERILNLIRNWKIHFSGDTSEVSVNEFIYRVNTLTNANLRGDFDLLCSYAHILFEGKAMKWFWRYHRSCDVIDWDDLCDALKRQYKDYNTDFDIRDDILRRKQRHNETFDEFYDAVMVLCDRLHTQISEHELCETLQRNLRPEVRHEILHLEITRIAQLRRAVRRHEKFIKDTSFSTLGKRTPQKSQISEVFEDDMNPHRGENAQNSDSEVCLVVKSGKCWNCDNVGHSFIDCLEPRTVFCYGCGAKNVYKPKCSNCQRKRENALKDVRAKPDGHPKQM